MKYMLPANTHLYRYDLVEPPVEWSTEYKSIEYQYFVHGCKNRIGAFFFFDSKYQAVKTAEIAVKKHPGCKGIWITECVTFDNIQLLELRYEKSTGCMMSILEEGIDIFNERYHKFGKNECNDFSHMRQSVLQLKEMIADTEWWRKGENHKLLDDVLKTIENTTGVQPEATGWFCQQLTDFHNGEVFKTDLQTKKFEGYIFNEANGTKGSNTICVFSSEKISRPVTHKYQ